MQKRLSRSVSHFIFRLTVCTTMLMLAYSTRAQDVPPATPAPVTYTVQRGDILYRISKQYGVTVAAIAAANGIVDVNRIKVGQVLVIPAAGTTVEAASVQPQATPNSPTTTAMVNISAPYDANSINGIPMTSIVVMPPQTVQTVRMIYTVGQAFKRNPTAFSKLGDSTIENPYFLARFDTTDYNLGNYSYLQTTIDAFRGSFGRDSVAVRRGLHSWSVYDPMWTDTSQCRMGETMLLCEIRLNNPMMLIIKLGSNDVGVPDQFEANMRRLVVDTTMQGVIPVLSTKADRHEGSDINNEIIRKLAAEYSIPLWDFDLLAGTLPARGLGEDQVHLTTFYAHDWRLPESLTRGYGLMELTGLMTVNTVWQAAVGN
ncbi:MAG: LysM peptidoglycan-binding domain-containing protein [Anaerolineaceae bacterium]|nr:LysM peptidoglycan-binding domain-containing protein [Anaerolineaceae bacterium]